MITPATVRGMMAPATIRGMIHPIIRCLIPATAKSMMAPATARRMMAPATARRMMAPATAWGTPVIVTKLICGLIDVIVMGLICGFIDVSLLLSRWPHGRVLHVKLSKQTILEYDMNVELLSLISLRHLSFCKHDVVWQTFPTL